MEDLTKGQYLNWIKDCTGDECESIGELGNGLSYSKIMHFVHPLSFNINKVDLSGAQNSEIAINNWKLLQTCFLNLNIAKKLDMHGLISQDIETNVEFVKWFYSTFSDRVKAVKCLETAKKIKALKEVELKNAEKIYDIEMENQTVLNEKHDECKEEHVEAQKGFEVEARKSKDADQAIQVAITAAGGIRNTLEKVLNHELLLASVNTKLKLDDNDPILGGPRKNLNTDAVWEKTEEAVNARDCATLAMRDYAEQHALALERSDLTKQASISAATKLKEQSARTEKAKIMKDMKLGEYRRALETVKLANYAIAILDAAENTDHKYKVKADRDANAALRRIENALDSFTAVKRSVSNLRTFSEIEEQF